MLAFVPDRFDLLIVFVFFFFKQKTAYEIWSVTGVQTCALPIYVAGAGRGGGYEWRADGQPVAVGAAALELSGDGKITKFTVVWDGSLLDDRAITALAARSEERRVGKEGRARWWPYRLHRRRRQA